MRFKGRYRVETARLKGWDYASEGWYFVTICTSERTSFFGEIVYDEMRLSPIGQIVAEEWRAGSLTQKASKKYRQPRIDCSIIVPVTSQG